MDTPTALKYRRRAQVIKALAHPSRLYIVDRLAQREHCVNELTALIGSDASTVSKHLSVLKSVGIVQDDRRGVSIYYSLRVPCILDFFSCADAVIDAVRRGDGAVVCALPVAARNPRGAQHER